MFESLRSEAAHLDEKEWERIIGELILMEQSAKTNVTMSASPYVLDEFDRQLIDRAIKISTKLKVN